MNMTETKGHLHGPRYTVRHDRPQCYPEEVLRHYQAIAQYMAAHRDIENLLEERSPERIPLEKLGGPG